MCRGPVTNPAAGAAAPRSACQAAAAASGGAPPGRRPPVDRRTASTAAGCLDGAAHLPHADGTVGVAWGGGGGRGLRATVRVCGGWGAPCRAQGGTCTRPRPRVVHLPTASLGRFDSPRPQLSSFSTNWSARPTHIPQKQQSPSHRSTGSSHRRTRPGTRSRAPAAQAQGARGQVSRLPGPRVAFPRRPWRRTSFTAARAAAPTHNVFRSHWGTSQLRQLSPGPSWSARAARGAARPPGTWTCKKNKARKVGAGLSVSCRLHAGFRGAAPGKEVRTPCHATPRHTPSRLHACKRIASRSQTPRSLAGTGRGTDKKQEKEHRRRIDRCQPLTPGPRS